jgi:hypothetical protein
VLTTFAAEDNCSTPFHVHHRPVPKLDHAADAGVELGEGTVGTSHVIGGPGVDDPPQ